MNGTGHWRQTAAKLPVCSCNQQCSMSQQRQSKQMTHAQKHILDSFNGHFHCEPKLNNCLLPSLPSVDLKKTGDNYGGQLEQILHNTVQPDIKSASAIKSRKRKFQYSDLDSVIQETTKNMFWNKADINQKSNDISVKASYTFKIKSKRHIIMLCASPVPTSKMKH